jgi:hypothetical protein
MDRNTLQVTWLCVFRYGSIDAQHDRQSDLLPVSSSVVLSVGVLHSTFSKGVIHARKLVIVRVMLHDPSQSLRKLLPVKRCDV